jgi:hypothetical protein
VVAAGVRVGHSGGMLVHRDGAASAYTNPVRNAGARPTGAMARPDATDDDDR